MKLTELSHDVLLEICGYVYEDHPRDRVFLGTWECGPPAQILLDLASMHSQLATATRPYIWREVAVVFAGTNHEEELVEVYNPTHFERAQRPHIARLVRAVFIVYCWPDSSWDGMLPQSLAGAISCFTSLRSVCFTRFPNQADETLMYIDGRLAASIRMHPSIHTLSVCAMTDCSDLIEPNTTKTYNIALNFCLGDSMDLLPRPKAVKSLYLRTYSYEPQSVADSWPSNIWDTLEHLDAGYDTTNAGDDSQDRINQRFIFASFKNYLSTGRRPALRSLDLSGVLPDHVALYFEFWVNFPKVKKLRVATPFLAEDFRSTRFRIEPESIEVLQKFSDLVDLSVSFDRKNVDKSKVAELGQPAMQLLADACPLLRSVEMVVRSDSLHSPCITQYTIRRCGECGTAKDQVAPRRSLDGTVSEFLQWK